MTKPDSLTVRVYGLLQHKGQILLSKENIYGKNFTKFPGGGLELGEGVLDCLQREFMEEVNIELSRWTLFHINESFLQSTFDSTMQVLSIYYKVWSDQADKVITGDPQETSLLKAHSDQILYWSDLQLLRQEPIQLPIDQEVVQLLV